MLDLAAKFEEFSNLKPESEIAGADSKVLLVDSLNSYCRCFAAAPTMNDDGEHVGGVTGFLRSVGSAVRMHKPSRVVFVFDGKGGSSARRKLFEGYKDNRKPNQRFNRAYNFKDLNQEQKAMRWQLKLLVEITENLPVNVIAIDNIEADDALAYIAAVVQERGGTAIIMSTDKDFLQLVGPTCKVYNPVKKKLYNETMVAEEYGIHPNNFLIYRVMDGDKSDNVPGIRGVGLKTIKRQFPELEQSAPVTFDDLYEKCTGSDVSVCQKLLASKELIERNIKLMSLKELCISGTIKMSILEQYNRPIPKLNKLNLTNLFMHHKLFGAFPSFDDWILTTWLPLTRYSEK